MVTFVVWCVIALLLLVAVFLVANVMERRDDTSVESVHGRGVTGFWRSFRAGLRREGRRRAVPEAVETDLDTFFAGTVETGPAYVDAEQMADVIQRARLQASRQLHVGTVRHPEAHGS
jgi:hypothetical protein